MEQKIEEQSSDDISEQISSVTCDIEPRSITTEHLILRKADMNDVDAISILANNFAVASMLSTMPHPYGRADAAYFVDNIANHTDKSTNTSKNGKCVFAITLRKSGELIGCCGINRKQTHDHFELGYWLGEPYWGNGYGTQVAHALVDLAFTKPDVDQIRGSCRITNAASRRVLQKSGFQFISTGMSKCLALSGDVPTEHYRLDRKTWSSLRNWSNSE